MELLVVNGSLHSHGCWTDYRNPAEQAGFPFSLESFVRLYLECGRSFASVSDRRAHHSGKPAFREEMYEKLLETADPQNPDCYLEKRGSESIIWLNDAGQEFIIIRTQEVLTDKPFKHILAVGAEKDIKGGNLPLETLKEIRESGGYAVINHPFMRNAWTEQEIRELHAKGLVHALEWSSFVSFPKWLPPFFPTKEANARVLELQDTIPVIANDDSSCKEAVKFGSFTSYEVNCSPSSLAGRIRNAIKTARFHRNELYSPIVAPFKHVWYGWQSSRLFKEKALPAP